jgi:tetratricopeptide (TPR) repeat protein
LVKEPENSYYQNRFSRIMTVKGVTLMALQRYDEAATLQEKAYDKYTKLNDLRGRGNAAISRAQVAEKMEKSDDVRKWFTVALELSANDPEINNIAKEGLARLSS